MTKTENYEKVEVTSPAELRAWLEAHHKQAESVWLVTFKKHTGAKYVSTQQVLDELLCFGWVDGIRRKVDDERTMQLISPRKTQYWARSYKERAARLTAEGRMHDAGLRTIEESKCSGLWNFMDDVDALVVPDDLASALDQHAGAAEYFNDMADSNKRNILRWIKLAKQPETRAKRIDRTVDYAARGQHMPNM